MPPPLMVAEVVSPGKASRERDYERKRAQYQHRGILEYWIIDREQEALTVLYLENSEYVEIGVFRGSDHLLSPLFPQLALTAAEIFAAAQ